MATVDTTLTFYQSASDYRTLDKVLGTAIGTATGQLHEKINDLEMIIMLPGEYLNYCQTSNIVYNSTTQKYYYLSSYDVENNLVFAHLKEDVRLTFATQIKNVTATIVRNENLKQGYLSDSGYNALAYEGVQYKTFPNAMTDASYILVTVG